MMTYEELDDQRMEFREALKDLSGFMRDDNAHSMRVFNDYCIRLMRTSSAIVDNQELFIDELMRTEDETGDSP